MMALERQVTFWIAALAVFIAVLWLLSEMLLPFIAGMALAYLLDPIARRAQTLGIPRAVSALVMVTLVIVLLVVAVMAAAPIVGQQYVALLNKLPGYVDRLQSLVADPSQSWLGSVLGEQLPDAKKSVGSLVSHGAGFVTGFLGSLWSGGRAVLSMLSLLVITPVVAFYLLCDWERFVVTVDSWIPLQHRDTVRGLTRDIDNAITGANQLIEQLQKGAPFPAVARQFSSAATAARPVRPIVLARSTRKPTTSFNRPPAAPLTGMPQATSPDKAPPWEAY
ncbi:MAG: AI-2E family transporter, partial [Hyphomicrobiales bacterium]